MPVPPALPVLMYHQVLRARAQAGRFDTWVLESALRRQLGYLKRAGFRTTTFRELDRGLKPGPRSVVLTFDDGYLDNYTTLFPILQELGFTAVIFMVTGLRTNAWAAAQGEPETPLMSPAQAREMATHGVEFGGHTRHHVNFDHASAEESRSEIRGCKEDLEQWLSEPAVSFAYPYGAARAEAKRLVEEAGFRFGVATKSGPASYLEDRYQVRRLAISHRTGMLTYRLKVSGHYLEPLHGLLRLPAG